MYVDYQTYLDQYKDFTRPAREIVIPAVNYSRTDAEIEILDGLLLMMERFL